MALARSFRLTLRLSLLLLGLAAASAAAAPLDTAKLDEARSAVAEAAAVTRAEAQGRVTRTYAEGLREAIRRDLEKLRQDPQFGPVARAALQALERKDEAALQALRDQLIVIERAHGRSG